MLEPREPTLGLFDVCSSLNDIDDEPTSVAPSLGLPVGNVAVVVAKEHSLFLMEQLAHIGLDSSHLDC